MAFSRSAIHLLSRIPKMPAGGDAATFEMVIQDPITGIPFRFAQYKGWYANQFSVSTVWGCKIVAPQHTALLLGN
jgi:hypothetical protein